VLTIISQSSDKVDRIFCGENLHVAMMGVTHGGRVVIPIVQAQLLAYRAGPACAKIIIMQSCK